MISCTALLADKSGRSPLESTHVIQLDIIRLILLLQLHLLDWTSRLFSIVLIILPVKFPCCHRLEFPFIVVLILDSNSETKVRTYGAISVILSV